MFQYQLRDTFTEPVLELIVVEQKVFRIINYIKKNDALVLLMIVYVYYVIANVVVHSHYTCDTLHNNNNVDVCKVNI